MAEGVVTLTGPGVSLTLQLGADAPTLDDLGPSIEEIERIERKPITHWQAPGIVRMKVPVLLDGLADDADQQPVLDQIRAIATTDDEPDPLTATGAIPLVNRQWWLESVAEAESNRNAAGVLVRQALTLGLVEPVSADVLPAAVKPNAGRGGGRGGGGTYTTKKGDTLRKIAAHLYGDPSFAKLIGDLNGIRDTRKELAPGRVLRLPLTAKLGKAK